MNMMAMIILNDGITDPWLCLVVDFTKRELFT